MPNELPKKNEQKSLLQERCRYLLFHTTKHTGYNSSKPISSKQSYKL